MFFDGNTRHNIIQNRNLRSTICPKCKNVIFYISPKPDRCPECGAPIEKSNLTRLAEKIEDMIEY